MSGRLILGICGYKGAGKDTLGHGASNYLMGVVNRVALDRNFADPLKNVCSEVFGLGYEHLEDRAGKEKRLDRWPFMSPREIMQKVGTECFRAQFPGVWLRAWEREVDAYPNYDIITTDYRFPDEAELLQRKGAKLVKVIRPGLEADGHESESYVDKLPFDFAIHNEQKSAEAFAEYGVNSLIQWGVLPGKAEPEPPPIQAGDQVVSTDDGSTGKVVSIHGELAFVDWDNLGKFMWPVSAVAKVSR